MCGIFGIDGHEDAANLTYLGPLRAPAPRPGVGRHRLLGRPADARRARHGSRRRRLQRAQCSQRLPGARAIGHTRYSTAGKSVIANAQPIVVKTSMGPLGHRPQRQPGQRRRAARSAWRREGSIFQTTSDTEVILHLMARNPQRRRGRVAAARRSARCAAPTRSSCSPTTRWSRRATRTASGRCCMGELRGRGLLRLRDLRLRPPRARRSSASSSPARWWWRAPARLEIFQPAAGPSSRRAASSSTSTSRAPTAGSSATRSRQARLAMGARLAREAPAAADVVVPIPDSRPLRRPRLQPRVGAAARVRADPQPLRRAHLHRAQAARSATSASRSSSIRCAS